MRQIPEEYINIVNNIINEILIYDNTKNLSWTKVYEEILKKLNLINYKENYYLLNYVITKLTILGYDIEPLPFKLNKYI